MNDMAKNLLLWIVIALILMMVFNNFGPHNPSPQMVEYSQFITDVQQGHIQRVEIEGHTIRGINKNGQPFVTHNPDDPGLMKDLLDNHVVIVSRPPEQQSLLMQIFISWFPMLLLFGVLIFFMRQMQGGGGRGALSFGKSRARMIEEDQIKVTFAD